MVTQNKTARRTSYSTTKDLRESVHKITNDCGMWRSDAGVRSLVTNLHFDIQEDNDELTETTNELIMTVLSATLRSDLTEDQRAVLAHAAELSCLVDECMRDDTDVCESDVIYYTRRLSEQRKNAGLIQYEDICD